MATVYLAQDLKHHRRVAIKVLRPELAAVIGPERFLREIEVTAQLNHPHILPLLDSGEADGFLYYVMPYVEGESLRGRLNREKQLPIDDALEIAREVADALDYAHRHAVVHRDIKPENILLEERHAVVADFGIARAIDVAGGERLTATGVAVGTPEYMSPEQAGARGDLDGRSDIYALGCVLHEMLAGQPPFTGTTVESVIHQHLTAEPAPVTSIRAGVPGETAAAIRRALAKTPADRFSTGRDFVTALGRVAPAGSTRARAGRPWLKTAALVLGGAALALGVWFAAQRFGRAGQPITSIAVLPFADLGNDPAQEYFADGMTEALIAELGQIKALRVISRTSVMHYKKVVNKSASDIARELNVGAVVEGSVLRAGGRVRIVAQLIGVAPERHLWAATYERELADVLALHGEVASAIAREIRITVTPDEATRLAASSKVDPEAYDYFLRGRTYAAQQSTDVDLARAAVEMFERAVARDPTFVEAHAQLVAGLAFLAWQWTDAGAVPRAASALNRLVGLAPDQPATIAAKAWYALYASRDLETALSYFERVREVEPNNADVIATIGNILVRQGKWEQGVEAVAHAVNLDPGGGMRSLCFVSLMMRRYGEAERCLNRSISDAPRSPDNYHVKAVLYLLRDGDTAEAAAVLEELSRLVPTWVYGPPILRNVFARRFRARLDAYRLMRVSSADSTGYYFSKAVLAAQDGQAVISRTYYDSARVVLERRLRTVPDTATFTHIWHSALGQAYAGLGRKADAIREGRRAVQLVPVSRDARSGALIDLDGLARIYARVGEDDLAIDVLEQLLAIPSWISVGGLRVDPEWDGLRSNPRFQALLAKYHK